MEKAQRFTHSFKPIVKLKPGKKCSLKSHWSGVCNQVAGYLDCIAALDETGERFVYARVQKITSRSKKVKDKSKNFKDKPKYSQSAVEAALKRFRADKVIGPRVERKRDGIVREGYIVAAHDSITSIIGDRCCWHGFTPHFKGESTGQSAVESTGQSAVETVVPSTVESVVNVSAQSPEPKSDNPQNRPLAFQPLRDTKTGQTVPAKPTPVTGAAKNGNGTVRDGVAAQSFTAEEEKLWKEMRNHEDFPSEMVTAIPRQDKGEKRRVLEQLKKYGVEVVVQAIETWADERDMGLSGLSTKWRAWLEEGEPLLRKT